MSKRTISLVSDLYSIRELKTILGTLKDTPGVNIWWFTGKGAELLNVPKGNVRIINGVEYYPLYIGETEKIRTRIKQHLAIAKGDSVLRSNSIEKIEAQTGKLNKNFAKHLINSILESCYVEIFYVKTKEDAIYIKETEINEGYDYPLNKEK